MMIYKEDVPIIYIEKQLKWNIYQDPKDYHLEKVTFTVHKNKIPEVGLMILNFNNMLIIHMHALKLLIKIYMEEIFRFLLLIP